MTLIFTDTHCHLDFDEFLDDRDQVVERARANGLERILNPGIDLETSQAAIALAEQYPEVYAAVGIHPNSASIWASSLFGEIAELAKYPKVVAIGEIGLDYYRDHTPRELQRQALIEQLNLALKINLPVILHNRNASNDILGILKDWTTQLVKVGSKLIAQPGVLHSYSDNLDVAQKAILLGFFIGITGPVTFRNAVGLQNVVKSLPIEKLLIETDAPFLAPHPVRGRRNEPSYIIKVAEKIAELKGLPLSDVANITTANANRLFHWRDSF